MRRRFMEYSGYAAILEKPKGRVACPVCKVTGVTFPVFEHTDAPNLLVAVRQATAAGLKAEICRVNIRVETVPDGEVN